MRYNCTEYFDSRAGWSHEELFHMRKLRADGASPIRGTHGCLPLATANAKLAAFSPSRRIYLVARGQPDQLRGLSSNPAENVTMKQLGLRDSSKQYNTRPHLFFLVYPDFLRFSPDVTSSCAGMSAEGEKR